MLYNAPFLRTEMRRTQLNILWWAITDIHDIQDEYPPTYKQTSQSRLRIRKLKKPNIPLFVKASHAVKVKLLDLSFTILNIPYTHSNIGIRNIRKGSCFFALPSKTHCRDVYFHSLSLTQNSNTTSTCIINPHVIIPVPESISLAKVRTFSR